MREGGRKEGRRRALARFAKGRSSILVGISFCSLSFLALLQIITDSANITGFKNAKLSKCPNFFWLFLKHRID